MTASRPVEVTFLMADLSGFTALTEAPGDTHAMDVVTRFMEIVEASLRPLRHAPNPTSTVPRSEC